MKTVVFLVLMMAQSAFALTAGSYSGQGILSNLQIAKRGSRQFTVTANVCYGGRCKPLTAIIEKDQNNDWVSVSGDLVAKWGNKISTWTCHFPVELRISEDQDQLFITERVPTALPRFIDFACPDLNSYDHIEQNAYTLVK